MDGIERLQQQHEQLVAALEELDITTATEERIRLFVHIGQRLKAHAAVEDEVFYAAIEAMGDAYATRMVAEARETHIAVDVLLDEILGAEASATRVGVLRQLVERHFADEERTLFAMVQRLKADARAALNTAIQTYLEKFGDGAEDTLPAP